MLLQNKLLILPSERALRRITATLGEPSQSTSIKYLNTRRSELNSFEANVNLIFDEIYIASRVEYSSASGKLFGLTSEGQLASTILCFMASSVCGRFQDVVALIPMSHFDTRKLQAATLDVLKLLDSSGFNVVSICCDNHLVNRSFFKNILCEGNLTSSVAHPITKKPLFLLFDSVHNFKNVYNNLYNRRELAFPDFDDPDVKHCASFDDICSLYAKELQRPLKMAHKLNAKSLEPKNIEKTSVKLASAIFHESTLNALNYFCINENKQWNGTAKFIDIVLKMWKIVNVKTPSIGHHKKDAFREPILRCDDFKLQYLEKFAHFIQTWSSSGMRCLSKETCLALKHTSLSLCSLAKYLLSDLGFSYVLLGKLQSDPLESRFG